MNKVDKQIKAKRRRPAKVLPAGFHKTRVDEQLLRNLVIDRRWDAVRSLLASLYSAANVLPRRLTRSRKNNE